MIFSSIVPVVHMKFLYPTTLILAVLCIATAPAQDSPTPSAETSVAKTHPAHETITKAVNAFGSGQGDASLQLFVSAHEKHPDLAPGQVMFARLAFSTNQIKAGLKALEIAAVKHPEDPEVWNMLADLALRGGRLAESQVLFTKAMEATESFSENAARKNKQTINAHAGLATVYQRRQQWKLAEDHLRAWIALDQRNSSPWQRLAGVFFNTDRYDTAMKTLENLRTFDSNQPLPEVTMGTLCQAAGQHEKAEQFMRQAISKDSNGLSTRISVARWALTAGEKDLLKTCSVKAKELSPDSPAVNALLGMSARFEGNATKAEQIFASMLQKNPASFDAANGLALALLEQDDKEKHRTALQHAQVLVQSNPDRRTTRGRAAAAVFAWALHHLDQPQPAAKVIKTVITSGEISPEISYFAAAILANAEEKELAKELIKGALGSHIAFAQQEQAKALLLEIES